MLVEISRETFIETFAADNTTANLENYLESNFTFEKLSNEFSEKGNNFYLAFVDQQPAGYLKLGTSHLPAQITGKRALEIERIYVLKKFHGKKIGASLMEQAIKEALEKGFDEIHLGVWEKNEKAIAFYKKWGFDIYGSHIFTLGDDPQTDLLMKKTLADGSVKSNTI